MDIDISDIKKKKSLHNIKLRKNKISSGCKRRSSRISHQEGFFLSMTNSIKFFLAFTLTVLLIPFIFLKEIDVYLEESMFNTLKKV